MRPLQIFLLIFSLSPAMVVGQSLLNQALTPNAEWGEGTIMLNDGKELKGLIRYNDKTGVLSFESVSDSRSFTSRSTVGFEYFDGRVSAQRVFYPIPYEDKERNVVTPLFFEVLRQFKTF